MKKFLLDLLCALAAVWCPDYWLKTIQREDDNDGFFV